MNDKGDWGFPVKVRPFLHIETGPKSLYIFYSQLIFNVDVPISHIFYFIKTNSNFRTSTILEINRYDYIILKKLNELVNFIKAICTYKKGIYIYFDKSFITTF